ncbi:MULTISPECIES: hypothetical protein [unclassified Bradyrhizobium]|jgi:hypothetical protein|uniref:hypothetical protein n=1 Tax=unclassified Bradyrhizobium TaxID=2631580 RepID=UPI001404ED20|nr:MULTISPECIES: hypothetical protein [unclassified Bradyrhizobium]
MAGASITVTAAGSAVTALDTSPRPGVAPAERAALDCCCDEVCVTGDRCARRAAFVLAEGSARRMRLGGASGAATMTGGKGPAADAAGAVWA